ncbi:hypothetical protein ABZ615_11865 [Streptomyces sp. NPDC007325]|uniref:hypothetical protein n=1 Tax=Streptomyces sp. NPDC007325 TaxID=3154588 RepID=UPI0033E171F4
MTVEGLVDGPVTIDSMTRRMVGVGVLVALVLVHLTVAVAESALSLGGGEGDVGAGGMPFGDLVRLLLTFLLSLVVIGFAMRMALGGSPGLLGGGRGGGGVLSLLGALVRGAFRLIAMLLRLVVGGLVQGFRAGSRATQSAGQGNLQQTVRRFRIRDRSGDLTNCTLPGELLGPEVRQGDLVRVSSRGLRGGHLRVRRVEVLSAPGGTVATVVTTRTARRFRIGVWADGCAWALAAVLALLLAGRIMEALS